MRLISVLVIFKIVLYFKLIIVCFRITFFCLVGGRGIAVGPILGEDGFSDIYFVNEGNSALGNRGDNALFENDGLGHFKNVAKTVSKLST